MTDVARTNLPPYLIWWTDAADVESIGPDPDLPLPVSMAYRHRAALDGRGRIYGWTEALGIWGVSPLPWDCSGAIGQVLADGSHGGVIFLACYFDRIYKLNRGIVTDLEFAEIWPAIVRSHEPVPCLACGRPTNRLVVVWAGPLCSTACEDSWERDFWQATVIDPVKDILRDHNRALFKIEEDFGVGF